MDEPWRASVNNNLWQPTKRAYSFNWQYKASQQTSQTAENRESRDVSSFGENSWYNLARRFLPGDPTGHQINGGSNSSWKTVVGVVTDSKTPGLNQPPAPQKFLDLDGSVRV